MTRPPLPAPQRVVVVHAPGASVTQPCWATARTSAYLRAVGLAVTERDANLELATRVLNLDPEARTAADTLRSPRFFDPTACAAAVRQVRDAFARADPERGQPWGKGSRAGTALRALAGEIAEQSGGASSAEALVLVARDPLPAVAAGVMAERWRRARPGAPAVLLGNPDGAGRTGPFDAVLAVEDTAALAALLGAPAPPAGRAAAAAGSGSAGFPGGGYWTPVPVVPLGDTAEFRRDPHALGRFLRRLTSRVAAGVVVSCDPGLTPERWSAALAGAAPKTFPWAALTCNLDRAGNAEHAVAAHAAGIRVIRWRAGGNPDAGTVKTLKPYAAAGIWNHVVLDADPVSASLGGLAEAPNIVHSWSLTRAPEAPPPWPGTASPPPDAPGYGNVTSLPGTPFWKVLADPAWLLLEVGRHGAARVARWRAGDDVGGVYELGQGIRYRFLPPRELPSGYLDEICRMVEAGGAVDNRWVRGNLERAYLIAVAEEAGAIVGNSSLKHPRPEYVQRIREKCGLDIEGFLERGYTSVRPEYRGLGVGTRLLEGLTARAASHGIYSIIREDDRATQTIALRNNTVKVAAFYSEIMGKEIGLWMPAETAPRRAPATPA